MHPSKVSRTVLPTKASLEPPAKPLRFQVYIDPVPVPLLHSEPRVSTSTKSPLTYPVRILTLKTDHSQSDRPPVALPKVSSSLGKRPPVRDSRIGLSDSSPPSTRRFRFRSRSRPPTPALQVTAARSLDFLSDKENAELDLSTSCPEAPDKSLINFDPQRHRPPVPVTHSRRRLPTPIPPAGTPAAPIRRPKAPSAFTYQQSEDRLAASLNRLTLRHRVKNLLRWV
ncbi:hypothetical protein BJ085DRAFT_38880 [Dimargaris cristalligena]|uniref:Uncharacterized protein n=1 Tax=Dimargaris cristalligena TaxID=215637 RepID=A0A4P9ZV45_9FUNG|nr:hypothetical protein BJ085DRAFT_38880 [Dimargaris cristalligena]|eukprot:RKP36791.1 hypothetical protein BJ085DRAFT_38880 [Dimargaris cristalligena]